MNLEPYQDPQLIRQALQCTRIAVVGMSGNELRASNFVGFYLSRHGYDVVPVNPRATTSMHLFHNQTGNPGSEYQHPAIPGPG